MISSSQHNTTWHRDTDIQSASYFMAWTSYNQWNVDNVIFVPDKHT